MTNESPAASGQTKTLMVLMHGLGSNGDDLFGLVPFLQKELPDTHFYSPDGIEECDSAPFGYQWFSLSNRELHTLTQELQRVIPHVTQLIDHKKKQLGLENKDVILLGFSQGSMTAMYLALSATEPYKSVVAFSGALIIPQNIVNTNTPVCLIHGTDDDVLPFSNMDISYNKLAELGVTVEKLAIHNLTHSINMQGIEKAISFIKEVQ